MPFMAGMPKHREAMRFSAPPNMGSPAPTGRPVTAHSTTPPTLSQSRRAASTTWRMRSLAAASMTGKYSHPRRSSSWGGMETGSKGWSWASPMEATWEATRIPRRWSSCRAMAPANTSGAVSLPEKWPPPRTSW